MILLIKGKLIVRQYNIESGIGGSFVGRIEGLLLL